MSEQNGIALPDDSTPQLPTEVTDYLAHLDQRSANEALRQFGEEFGVKTAEVNGVRYMLARDLAQLTYGYENTTGLVPLLQHRGEILKTFNEIAYQHDDLVLVSQRREQLGVSAIGAPPLLATWAHVLIAGTYGRTEAAEKVRDYIKRAELYARRQAMAISETGYSTEQIAAGMPQTGLTLQQLTEVKTIVVDAVNAAMEAIMLKALPSMVEQAVQSRMAALPPTEDVIMVTAGGFWKARQRDGWLAESPYVAMSLGQRLKGQGQKGRYPMPSLDRAFKAMVGEGVIYRHSRRTKAATL